MAKKQLARVVQDMVAMKERFTNIVLELDSNYQAVEQDTESQFKSYVDQLKQDTRQKIAALSQARTCLYTMLHDA
jgi:hypothetical protein